MNAFKDPKLNILACGYADLFSIHNRWNFDRVSVPYWRLYWNEKPGAMLIHGSRRVNLKPSSMVLIAPHTIYSTHNHGHIGQLYFHFQLMIPSRSLKPYIAAIPVDPCLRNLAGGIIALLRRQKPTTWRLSLYARALVELALANVIDDLGSFPVFDARVQSAIAYLEERLDEPISNAALAGQADLSVSAFAHLFKKQVGYSPCNFLMLKRVEKACLMLHFTNSPIKQIAEELGFYDRYHFSRVFKREQGMGPAEFRSNNYPFFREAPSPT